MSTLKHAGGDVSMPHAFTGGWGSRGLNSSVPSDRIIELVCHSSGLDGAAPAILAEGHTALSYGELLDAIDRTARILTATGVEPGDRVAIVASSGPEMVVLFLAVASMAACAPLNPAY